MARKFVFLLILAVILALTTNSIAVAAAQSGRDCPRGFSSETAMHHDDHMHPHRHIGTSADQNDDGYICDKPVTPDGGNPCACG